MDQKIISLLEKEFNKKKLDAKSHCAYCASRNAAFGNPFLEGCSCRPIQPGTMLHWP
jgi:hypothetical protein